MNDFIALSLNHCNLFFFIFLFFFLLFLMNFTETWPLEVFGLLVLTLITAGCSFTLISCLIRCKLSNPFIVNHSQRLVLGLRRIWLIWKWRMSWSDETIQMWTYSKTLRAELQLQTNLERKVLTFYSLRCRFSFFIICIYSRAAKKKERKKKAANYSQSSR